MHLGHTILQQRQMPVLVEQPGLDAGNVRGQLVSGPRLTCG
jgi:hypothetical protein